MPDQQLVIRLLCIYQTTIGQQFQLFYAVFIFLDKKYILIATGRGTIFFVADRLFDSQPVISFGFRKIAVLLIEKPDLIEVDGFFLPDKEDLLRTVREKIGECAKAGLFAQPPVTMLEVNAVIKKDKSKTADEEEEPVWSEGEDS